MSLRSQATRKVGDMMAFVLMKRILGAPAVVAIPHISGPLSVERTGAKLPFESSLPINSSFPASKIVSVNIEHFVCLLYFQK